jgi:hypothetical protein
MNVNCPICGQALDLTGITATQVQCPACRGLINLAAAPPAQPIPAAQPLPAAVGQHAPAPDYSPVTEVSPPAGGGARSRLRKKARQRDWQTLAMIGALVVVLGFLGAVAAVTIKLKPGKNDEQRVALPTAVAKAHELVADRFSGRTQFAQSGYECQQVKEDQWSVKSFVDIKGSDGVTLRTRFSVVVRQEAPDKWTLERLEIAGRRIPLATSVFSDPGTGNKSPMPDITPEPTPESTQEDRTVNRAMRRLAEVIGESASLRKTLVVWLFDVSPGAASWRDGAAGHFDKIYSELEKTRKPSGDPSKLQMTVMSFDSEAKWLIEEPTNDVAKLREVIGKFPDGKSGMEKPFAALRKAADKFGNFRQQGGYVLLVVVTDEAGDDDEKTMDDTTALLRKLDTPVYVIGKEAPFGRRAWSSGGDNNAADPRHDGPESVYPEKINLQFWERNFLDEQSEAGSGFGPYALSRVCHQTGGTYFVCDDVGGSGLTFSPRWNSEPRSVFSPKLRARYAPKYISFEEYHKFLASNKAAQALVDAGKQPFVEVAATLPLDFAAGDEAALRRALDAAQRGVARIEPRLDTLYQALSPGEADRKGLTEPRWQAGFDLAMGRILAMKARVEGYNAMLAVLKQGKNFKNKGSTAWVLAPSDTIGSGSKYEQMIKNARKYLERVVQEHPGTPWADLAKRELSAKLGWEWTER